MIFDVLDQLYFMKDQERKTKGNKNENTFSDRDLHMPSWPIIYYEAKVDPELLISLLQHLNNYKDRHDKCFTQWYGANPRPCTC